MWLFGYGSLIWKVDFPFEEKVIGYVTGFQRKFYQQSVDHRGTPDFPGRVVTLIPSSTDHKVYGIAYRIKEDKIESVLSHLDYREKGGYKRVSLKFFPKDENREPFDAIVYFGSSDNPNFCDKGQIEDIAEIVVKAIGPSGANFEYVCNLADSMRQIAPDVEDEHLFKLEGTVIRLKSQRRLESPSCIVKFA